MEQLSKSWGKRGIWKIFAHVRQWHSPVYFEELQARCELLVSPFGGLGDAA